ncbi:MAG: WbqC family protein [bacterium]|nr:WbqC family protein [bacterium]
MICAIHQPQYLPWLGYFDKLLRSDFFVLLDDVQYKKNEWQNRNKISTSHGWQWLTVPVHYTFGQKINEVLINNKTNWGKKHLHSLVINYSGTPYFKDYRAFFEEVYSKKWEYLCELNIYLIKNLATFLGIQTELVKSSDLQVDGQKTDRLVNICKKLQADIYLSGEGAREYLDLSLFENEKIKVVFQNFNHPIYPQVKLDGNFQPNMSVIDLLFNYGKDSLKILQKCTKPIGD